MNKQGMIYGICAYALWGFFPIYWKLLKDVPATQLLSHRIGWSFILIMIIITAGRQWRNFRIGFTRRNILIYFVAAVLIGINWLTYVWAVNAGFIVETSLGYFINPLWSMMLGMVFLRERVRLIQWVPIGLATIGVVYLTLAYGRLPWIALLLAFSFGFYGLVKKLAPLGSLFGLALETGILFLPAVIFLIAVEIAGTGAFIHAGAFATSLLVGAGVVTTIPLLMFVSSARRIPLTLLGVLQYIAPTIQFLLGVFIYKESFDRHHLIGFVIVWIALIIFFFENYLNRHSPVEPIAELGEG